MKDRHLQLIAMGLGVIIAVLFFILVFISHGDPFWSSCANCTVGGI